MGGQGSDKDKLTNGTTSYAKALSSQQSSKKKSLSPSASTLPSSSTSSSTTPKSKSSSPPAPSQQGKIDKSQWEVAEWFRHSEYWYIDFVKWILLASEEKETSEQNNIERG